MINSKISGVNELKNELNKIVKSLDAPMVTVGIHEDEADPPEGEINMATLGAVHEFGNDHIPARPWLQLGFESGLKDYEDIMSNGIDEVVSDGEDVTKVLHQVGVLAVGRVQEFITNLKTPANSPATIKSKGSSNPLIDEGHMRASVNYKLQVVKPEEGL